MICFAWSGFPQYAARCVGALVRDVDEEVVVIATRPRVPIAGMDALAGCRVVWVETSDSRHIREMVGELPRILFTSGWGVPLFNQYRDQVRDGGGKVIAMSDNNFQLSLKELVKALRFRFLIRSRYDGYFVAGRSGKALLRFYGVPESMIVTGLYAADGSLFFSEGSFVDRDKRIIYVGQFCDRKNILSMCRAFIKANALRDWTLEMCGCGPQNGLIPNDPNIEVHDFVQPEELAKLYRRARGFVLASKEEHWGLVVHEAALSGCVLLLSNRVGAKDDLLGMSNGFTFDPFDERAIRWAFESLMGMSDQRLIEAHSESLRLANNISIQKFAESVKKFL